MLTTEGFDIGADETLTNDHYADELILCAGQNTRIDLHDRHFARRACEGRSARKRCQNKTVDNMCDQFANQYHNQR